MKKQESRRKIAAVEPKRLEAVNGGAGYVLPTGEEQPTDPADPNSGS